MYTIQFNGYNFTEVIMEKEKLEEFITYVNNSKNKLEAFKIYASNNSYKYSSLRNLYYKHSKNNINIKKYEKFSEVDTKMLIDKINDNLSKGISIRKTCLSLANNNPTIMVRLQNKYREIVRKSYFKTKATNNTEILNFKPKQKQITEDDINSLFLGLVKLVKNRAIKEFKETYNFQLEEMKLKIQNLKKDLNYKDLIISSLNKKVKLLSTDN